MFGLVNNVFPDTLYRGTNTGQHPSFFLSCECLYVWLLKRKDNAAFLTQPAAIQQCNIYFKNITNIISGQPNNGCSWRGSQPPFQLKEAGTKLL